MNDIYRIETDWSNISTQKGMFCFTGLEPYHVEYLRKNFPYI